MEKAVEPFYESVKGAVASELTAPARKLLEGAQEVTDVVLKASPRLEKAIEYLRFKTVLRGTTGRVVPRPITNLTV